MVYNKTDVYNEEIKDLVKRILLICDKEKIPMFMSFAVQNDENGTKYISEMQSAASHGIELEKDLLVKHALVIAGIYPQSESN